MSYMDSLASTTAQPIYASRVVNPAGVSTIQDLYSNYLNRDGDADGMAYWNTQFMGDGKISDAEQQTFLGSVGSEINSRLGGAANPNVTTIQDLYTTALNRTGDQKGMDYWTNEFMGDGVISEAERATFALSAMTEIDSRFKPTPTPTPIPIPKVIVPTTSSAIDVDTPTYNNDRINNYDSTFTNPSMYWDEYSQGRGAQFTEEAARAMAKAGRTGMLPTLNSLAYQDYMSSYLPSVRKDLAVGLDYDKSMNNTLGMQYGNELNYSQNMYGHDQTRYGNELTSASREREIDLVNTRGMRELSIRETDLTNKTDLQTIELALKNLDISETTKRSLYNGIMTAWPTLSAAEKDSFLLEIGALLGVKLNSAKDLAQTITAATPG